MGYAIVIEKGEESYSGYPLDIDGIYAFADSLDEVTEMLRRAISDRIAELQAEGKAIPHASHTIANIHIAA